LKRLEVVTDASLLVALVVPLDCSLAAEQLFDEWLAQAATLLAPSLWRYEVPSALRRLIAAGALTRLQAQRGLDTLAGLGIEDVPATPKLQARALDLASALGQGSAYDAAYLAIAEAHKAHLYTADRRLANRAHQLGLDWVRAVG
jgi:predicted nucleic acid-binding protein